MPTANPQLANVELANRVGRDSRYYLLSPGEPAGGGLRVLYGGFERCLPDRSRHG